MTIAVNDIIKLLGDTQLKYRRLHFNDYTKELAPRSVTISNRINLPSFYRSLFDDSANLTVISVSGKKFSFWHSFLYCVYPNYINISWYGRKKLVDQFIEELNRDVQTYFKTDDIIRETTMDPVNVRFFDQEPSDELVYYLSSRFQINIVICDTTRLYFYFPGLTFQEELPTIMLYRDDSPTFHVISVSDLVITSSPSDKSLMKCLYDTVPEINRVLKNHTQMRKQNPKTKELEINSAYVHINKLTPEQTFTMEIKPKLNRLRIDELQALAQKYDIPIEKQGKTKKNVKKLKKELISDILQYHTTNDSA